MTELRMDASECTVCGSASLERHLVLGPQPLSNRFLAAQSASTAEPRYPLSLGMCETCGAVQLIDRMPVEAIRPRFDWLVYSEPEAHLDATVEKLSLLDGIGKKSTLLGITHQDQSTLDRMARLGFGNIDCVQPASLAIDEMPFGLETMQRQLSNTDIVDGLAKTYGAADLLIVRRIAEHAGSAKGMVKALGKLIAPGGYMALEVPDGERIFQSQNYPFLWEEHITYFTERSLAKLVGEVGAELVRLDRYPYAFEDSLVAIFRFPFDNVTVPASCSSDLEQARKLLKDIDKRFSARAAGMKDELQTLIDKGAKLAVFGAGHLAVKLINFYGIGGLIDCVIDDHPQKMGMLMPGSGLPIKPSAQLAELGITHCLSTLSPESEPKVRTKLKTYFEHGGQFISSFSSGGTA